MLWDLVFTYFFFTHSIQRVFKYFVKKETLSIVIHRYLYVYFSTIYNISVTMSPLSSLVVIVSICSGSDWTRVRLSWMSSIICSIVLASSVTTNRDLRRRWSCFDSFFDFLWRKFCNLGMNLFKKCYLIYGTFKKGLFKLTFSTFYLGRNCPLEANHS